MSNTKITESQRQSLILEMSRAADDIDVIERALLSDGSSAWTHAQSELLEFAQDEAERNELRLYHRESAREALGAIRWPGSAISHGDGIRSEYLETLRRQRDEAVGNI